MLVTRPPPCHYQRIGTKGLPAMAKNVRVPGYPWERLDEETNRTFELFEIYRELGPTRSLVKAAKVAGVGRQYLESLSVKFHWRYRVIEWDRCRMREKNSALRYGEADMRERHIQGAINIQAWTSRRFLSVTPEELRKLTLLQAARLTKIAVDIERGARMIPEDQAEEEPFRVIVNLVCDEKDSEREQLLATANRPAVEPEEI